MPNETASTAPELIAAKDRLDTRAITLIVISMRTLAER